MGLAQAPCTIRSAWLERIQVTGMAGTRGNSTLDTIHFFKKLVNSKGLLAQEPAEQNATGMDARERVIGSHAFLSKGCLLPFLTSMTTS